MMMEKYVTKDEFTTAMAELKAMMVIMASNFERVFAITRDIQRQLGNIEGFIAEIQENLADVTNAESLDAIASINHEARIARLERRNSIKPIPPAHLMGN
jgi:hypothetical protein